MTLTAEEITAAVDTREQSPLDLSPLKTIRRTLATGDYSVRGLEHVIAIERKSLPDLLTCIGQERARFEREVRRLLAYPVRGLVVEAQWSDLERGRWRSSVKPAAAIGSCLSWIVAGLPVVMAGNHVQAGRYVSRLLFLAARRRWRETAGFLKIVLSDQPASVDPQNLQRGAATGRAGPSRLHLNIADSCAIIPGGAE